MHHLFLCGIVLCLFHPVILYSQGSIHFAVIGDYGLAGQAELDVSNLVKSWNPDFIITVGDNNYEYGEASTIDANIGQYYHQFIYPYSGSYGSGDTLNRFFPAMGNHEWLTPGATPYLNYFTLPGNERYYDFVRGPVHFYVVDSDSSDPDGHTATSTQGTWLQNALSSSTEQWKLVYFHHPPYCSGTRHGSSPYMRWPFRQWGATAILTGHEHLYERLLEDSLVYFVNGLGGKSVYPIGAPVAGSQVRFNGDYGAMLVDANSDSITFQFITRAGVVIDTYTIRVPHYTPTVTHASGWNLISVPAVVPDGRKMTLFPTAISNAFRFDSVNYIQEDTLYPGLGYWIKFDSTGMVSVAGDSIFTDTVDVQLGWNMIGTISVPIDISSIIQEPAGIVDSKYYEFNAGYVPTGILLPGRAYWVKASQSGKLILSVPH
ncbi:MAG: metallophosphoesterase [Ignavibacteria bacterium]|nr:metallophosphoesterase [Ignavibacteria bacterium]MBI3765751.1 metallophosphoesterase [Ignavibacteriales bacterium]